MKKLLLILLCLPMIGFGQIRYSVNEVIFVDKPLDVSYHNEVLDFQHQLCYLKSTMELVTGKVFSLEDGQLFHEAEYLNGLKHGKEKWWFKNGQLEVLANYKFGKNDGVEKTYHENGKIKTIYHYSDGHDKPDSKQLSYYSNGQLFEEIILNDKSVLISETRYWPNGKIAVESFDKGNYIQRYWYDLEGNKISQSEHVKLWNKTARHLFVKDWH